VNRFEGPPRLAGAGLYHIVPGSQHPLPGLRAKIYRLLAMNGRERNFSGKTVPGTSANFKISRLSVARSPCANGGVRGLPVWGTDNGCAFNNQPMGAS